MVLIFEDKTNAYCSSIVYCFFIFILAGQYAGYIFNNYATKPLIDPMIKYAFIYNFFKI